MLKNMFSSINPPIYDQLNRIVTLSLDQLWRNLAAKKILKQNPSKVLDICCGTGDLSIAIAKNINKNKLDTQLIGADFCMPFLDYAKEKVQKLNLDIQFIEADAANLPFESNTFDVVGISFAFRNLTFNNPNSEKYLSEILRVLKQGGRFILIETSQPQNAIIREIFHLYMRIIPPVAGLLLRQNKRAYAYFAGSVVNFFSKTTAVNLLQKAGFDVIVFKPYLFGAVALVVAKKM